MNNFLRLERNDYDAIIYVNPIYIIAIEEQVGDGNTSVLTLKLGKDIEIIEIKGFIDDIFKK